MSARSSPFIFRRVPGLRAGLGSGPMTCVLAVLLATGLAVESLAGQEPLPPSSTRAPQWMQLERHDGFVPFYVDEAAGKLYLEITRFDESLLLVTALSGGGLDRRLWWDGWPWADTGPALVQFERRDSRVLLVARDASYRVSGDGHEALARAVDRAFVPSVIAATPVVGAHAGGVIVDATDVVLRDALDISTHLNDSGGGTARFDRQRSYVDATRSRARADQTEIETRLTFGVSDSPAPAETAVSDDATLTIRQRHAFGALPPR